MPKRLEALALSLVCCGWLAAADPDVEVRLTPDDVVLLAGAARTSASTVSPLADWAKRVLREGAPAPDPKAMRDAGILGEDGKLTDRGTRLWGGVCAPDLVFQVRRLHAQGVTVAWYAATGDAVWVMVPQPDGVRRVFGPLPGSDLPGLLAGRLGIPAPSEGTQLDETFTLPCWALLASLAREQRNQTFEELGEEPSDEPVSIDELCRAAVGPRALNILSSDPTIDMAAFWTEVGNAANARTHLDEMSAGGWIETVRTERGPGYRLSAKGKQVVDAVLRAQEDLQVTCLRLEGQKVRAASVLFALRETGVTRVAYRPASHEYHLEGLPKGDPTASVAGSIRALIEEVRAAAPVAPAGKLLGDTIREELGKGVFRSAPIVKTREVWGRGKPDVIAIGVGQDKRADVEYEDTTGDGQFDFVRVRDFPDGPFTRSFVLRDGKWEESNILEAYLEVNYSLPWGREAYHPHNVDIVLNGKVIAQLTEVIPEGLYRFPIRPQDLKVSADAASANEVRLQTTHLRGGHYVVSSNFNLVIRLSQVSRAVVAASEEEARKIVRERSGIVDSGVDPAVYVNEWRADPPAPESGKDVRIHGPVRNHGAETAHGVVVRFFDGDPAQGGTKFAEKAIDALDVGDPQEVEGVWKSAPGVHRIFVVLSLPEGTADLSKGNDQVSLTVKTGGDTEPPSLLVAEPADGSTVPAGRVVLSGTAKDNVAVASLEYSVDGGLWQRIDVAERWRIEVDLSKGDHRIRVRARDTSGLETEQTRTLKAE